MAERRRAAPASQLIKYGVVRTGAACEDLSHWNSLYVAGRMQKPVMTLRSDARVVAAAADNLRCALAAALLLLPARSRTLGSACRYIAHAPLTRPPANLPRRSASLRNPCSG